MMNWLHSQLRIMSTWRYEQDGQPRGPVETAALQALLNSGTLSPETLVWKDGMTNWVPARTLPEFAGTTPAGGTVPPVSPSAGVPPAAAPPPPPGGADTDAADIEKNKIFAVLAYIGILFLVPLLAAPQSKFARYHTNQGVVLFLAAIVASAASFVLVMVPFVGCLAAVLPVVVGVGSLVLMIMGIINAASGQCKPLPLIGQFQLIK